MSIINEALKKAEREGLLKSPPNKVPPPTDSEKFPPHRVVCASKEAKEANILLLLAICGVVGSAAILCSIVLIRNLSPLKVSPEFQKPGGPPEEKLEGSQGTMSDLEPSMSSIELNGIVYESEDTWAIINNKIVRLGDTVGDERIIEIGKDYVRLVNESSNTERRLFLR